MASLLRVEGLRVAFDTPRGRAVAVDGIDLALEAGETLCVVGESGCGKSVTALSVMGLVPSPPASVTGSIRFEGRELLGLSRRALADLRGDRLAMIFQEPMTSLNPAFTVGAQLGEVLVRHRGMNTHLGGALSVFDKRDDAELVWTMAARAPFSTSITS